MYRNCIFCSAPLGSNESLERFPVGRSLAFDGEKGRLWAVCGKCSRWNLAPIEERWEAIEDAERLFRDTRLRVQSENIGLAKLRDGTRLVRVGQALPGELAVWRYGAELHRRRRRFMAWQWAFLALYVGSVVASVGISQLIQLPFVWRTLRKDPELHRFRLGTLLPDQEVRLKVAAVREARLVAGEGGLGLEITVPVLRYTIEGIETFVDEPLAITGPLAHSLLRRVMVHVNAQGAAAVEVARAVDMLGASGSGQAFLDELAARREPVVLASLPGPQRDARSLALEMALHEETERRAMEGELALLEAMWREAEEIAGIADRLPNVPAPQPPRLAAGR